MQAHGWFRILPFPTLEAMDSAPRPAFRPQPVPAKTLLGSGAGLRGTGSPQWNYREGEGWEMRPGYDRGEKKILINIQVNK